MWNSKIGWIPSDIYICIHIYQRFTAKILNYSIKPTSYTLFFWMYGVNMHDDILVFLPCLTNNHTLWKYKPTVLVNRKYMILQSACKRSPWKQIYLWRHEKQRLAERSFDLRTSGLWAQHASTAPLCSTRSLRRKLGALAANPMVLHQMVSIKVISRRNIVLRVIHHIFNIYSSLYWEQACVLDWGTDSLIPKEWWANNL